MNERIKEVLEHYRVSQAMFAKSTRLSQPTINRAIKGDVPIRAELLVALLKQFPEVSAEWLITGKGEMLIKDNVGDNTAQSSGDNATSIAGHGNTNIAGDYNGCADNKAVEKAIDEITQMRLLLADAIKNNKEQSDKFLDIISQLSK